ncbi:hypothetical protein ECTW07945_2227, partial [Escherichia coli TW07945]
MLANIFHDSIAGAVTR